MEETLDESVQVEASFLGNRLRVRQFRWGSRWIPVRQVTYHWREQVGRDVVRHFAVTDGTDTYELAFSAATLEWKLVKVMGDG